MVWRKGPIAGSATNACAQFDGVDCAAGKFWRDHTQSSVPNGLRVSVETEGAAAAVGVDVGPVVPESRIPMNLAAPDVPRC